MLAMVIFDFDGVIADSEPAHFQMFRQILQPQGIEFTWSNYCEKYLGYEDEECIYRVLTDCGHQPSRALVTELARRKSLEFARYMEQNCVIMPGVPQLLADLRAHDVICSICSGALHREVLSILKQAYLEGFFAQIVAADDVTAGKPDPQGYRLTLTRANANLDGQTQIQPSQCLAIEDSIWGIQAAKAAGMACLAVTTSYPQENLVGADLIVKDLTCVDTARLSKLLP